MAPWVLSMQRSDSGPLNFNRNSKEHRHSPASETVINLVSGFSGGTANVLVGQPFDTAKTKMQIYPNFYKGMVDSMKQTWNQEKFRGIYSGLIPNLMVNVVEASAVFIIWPELQIQYAHFEGRKVEDLTVFEKACLGSAASVCSATLMTPFEVIKCRLQVSRENWILHQKKGPTPSVIARSQTPPTKEVFQKIVEYEGISAFAKGVHCAILRDIIGYFFYIGTYEMCLETLCPPCTRGAGHPSYSVFISGGLAGIMHYVTCFPIDVVKARIQNSSHRLTARSVALNLFRNEGAAYFWSGMTPVLIRTVPGSGVFFLVYETMRKHLRAKFIPYSEEAQEAALSLDGGWEEEAAPSQGAGGEDKTSPSKNGGS